MIENLKIIKGNIYDIERRASIIVSIETKDCDVLFFHNDSVKVKELEMTWKQSDENDQFTLICKKTKDESLLHLISFSVKKASKEDLYSDDYERYDPLGDVGMSMYNFI